MGWKIIISSSAEKDLEDIVTYIARHNPDAAARLGYALIARAEGLANFPELGRIVPEFSRPHLRELSHRSYRIIYRVNADERCIDIVRFWHAARGLPQIPRPERGHE
jgi:plasmid stabilization system protein ParE